MADANKSVLDAFFKIHDFLVANAKMPIRRQLMDEVDWNDHILEDLLDGVVNCHLHDNNAVTDQHLPPGQGCVDWKNIASLLKRAPRLKCIQSEVKIVQGGISFSKLSGIFNHIFNNEE